jgi:transposase InsO family protein
MHDGIRDVGITLPVLLARLRGKYVVPTNILQQQAKLDAFLEEFNNERPHEALQMRFP